ncbi:unnamed protein product, partial [Ectocarpus sp. 12 AP-2014]
GGRPALGSANSPPENRLRVEGDGTHSAYPRLRPGSSRDRRGPPRSRRRHKSPPQAPPDNAPATSTPNPGATPTGIPAITSH